VHSLDTNKIRGHASILDGSFCLFVLQPTTNNLSRNITSRNLLWSDEGYADPRATLSIPASVVLTASSQIWRFIAFPTTGTRHRVPKSVQSATSIHASHISILVHGERRSHLPRLLRLTTSWSLLLRAPTQLRIHLTSPLARASRYVQINLSIQPTQLATA
jgi:hypothetical protein